MRLLSVIWKREITNKTEPLHRLNIQLFSAKHNKQWYQRLFSGLLLYLRKKVLTLPQPNIRPQTVTL